jgi:hypothetical protein
LEAARDGARVCRGARGAVVGARCAVPGVVFVQCSSGLRLALLFRLAAIVLGLCCRCFLCFSMLLPCAVALVCSPIFGVTQYMRLTWRTAQDASHMCSVRLSLNT